MWTWIVWIGCGASEHETAAPAPAPAPAPVPAPAPAPAAPAGEQPGAEGNGVDARAPGECPPGVTANPGWEGEYPSPVLDVTKEVTVQGRRAPCEPQATETCAVPAGIYHPWSKVAAEYVTVRGVERYRLTRDATIGEVAAKAGDEVLLVAYLSEGFCRLGIGGRTVEAECPGLAEDDPFEKVAGTDAPTRQLVRVACGGGAEVWVDAAELLRAEGVREGEIVGFGEVGPGGG